MNSQQILARFQLSVAANSQPLITHPQKTRRASAVMLPLIDINNSAHILLCKRPHYLKHHPGEICLPGGKRELNDKNLRDTALRELYEELNINSTHVNVIGQLSEYATLTGFTITPFVGVLNPHTQWLEDPNEVAASFLIPISALINTDNWQPIPFQRFGKTLTLEGFSTSHGLLWGATASIIKNFTNQLAIPV
ncbi:MULTISPECIES: CoA pyrophosphatase [unclassified Pseudoalteromonas]|uniref:NUDIX hydrolase n=1 Tax=unclassified Pseudoalteromonas TaxID=194690 RepID=UPI000B3CFE22|nr:MULTISPECIES: CoA pyrophosphatase [unclassified Pseudoalteromonas]MDN3380011.1 CoA pyrophosphatase [Pseudoalteromonas sp. APC 3893]MDN3388350.1 CoA pyrophosphatase [Pseudoalteromonas sp. APC 4017]OUS68663.1 coenzyme A pyrophosphatase [Pseudoalteromonas sp. A601]